MTEQQLFVKDMFIRVKWKVHETRGGKERGREKREREKEREYTVLYYIYSSSIYEVKAWVNKIFVMKFSGPSLNRAFLPLCFPATMRYHSISERMEDDLNAGVYAGPKDWENMCRTGFGQKAEARSEGQRSRSCCWSCDGCSLRSGLEKKQLTYLKTGKSHNSEFHLLFPSANFFSSSHWSRSWWNILVYWKAWGRAAK